MGRITDYPEITALSDGDYLIVDNAEGGTKKVSAQLVAGTIDPIPTEDSQNAVRSDGVYNALSTLTEEIDETQDNVYHVYPREIFRSSTGINNISDGAENIPLYSLTCDICPIMSGSGTPSIDNVRTISARSEINIYHSNKNLIPADMYQESPEKVLLGVDSADGLIFLKAGTYTMSVTMKDETVTVTPYWEYGNTTSHASGCTLHEDTYVSIYLYDENGIATNSVKSFQLEIGNTNTTYVAHEGEITNVVFPSDNGDIYLGSIDPVLGTLRIKGIMYERNSSTMNNTENKPGWSYTGLRAYDVKVGTFDTVEYWDEYASNRQIRYTQVNVGSVYSVEYENDDYNVILPVDTYGLTQSQWISLGIDIQIIVTLQTPLEINISKEDIKTFLGTNIYYTDSSLFTLGYRKDVESLIKNIASTFTVTRDSIMTALGYDTDDDLVNTDIAGLIAGEVFATEIATPTFLATDNMSKSVIQNAFGIDAPIVAPSTIESTTVLINRLNPRTWFVWLNGAEVEFSRLGVSLNATNNAITLYLHGRTSMCTGIMGVDNAWTVTTL